MMAVGSVVGVCLCGWGLVGGVVGVVGKGLGCLSWDFCAGCLSGLLCFFLEVQALGADGTMYLCKVLDLLGRSIMATSLTWKTKETKYSRTPDSECVNR